MFQQKSILLFISLWLWRWCAVFKLRCVCTSSIVLWSRNRNKYKGGGKPFGTWASFFSRVKWWGGTYAVGPVRKAYLCRAIAEALKRQPLWCPCSIPGQSIWDLWWTESHWDRLSSSTSVLPTLCHPTNVSYSFVWPSLLMALLNNTLKRDGNIFSLSLCKLCQLIYPSLYA